MVGNQAWLNYVRQALEQQFPNLAGSAYRVIAPDTNEYNCVAWAAGDTARWWWVGEDDEVYWLPEVPNERTLEAFIKLFEVLGYEVSHSEDIEGLRQPRIAIYTNEKNQPTHVAKQELSGMWTSKIGGCELIEHNSLAALEGPSPAYGKVSCLMQKRV